MRTALLSISAGTVAVEALPGLPPLKAALVSLVVQVGVQAVTALSKLLTSKLRTLGAARRRRKAAAHAGL